MALPEKILTLLNTTDISELNNILERPQDYNLSLFEFCELADYLCKIKKNVDECMPTPDEKYDKLLKEKQALEAENKKLKAKIRIFEEFVDEVEYAYDAFNDDMKEYV